jgi:hypothetical protein
MTTRQLTLVLRRAVRHWPAAHTRAAVAQRISTVAAYQPPPGPRIWLMWLRDTVMVCCFSACALLLPLLLCLALVYWGKSVPLETAQHSLSAYGAFECEDARAPRLLWCWRMSSPIMQEMQAN